MLLTGAPDLPENPGLPLSPVLPCDNKAQLIKENVGLRHNNNSDNLDIELSESLCFLKVGMCGWQAVN